MKHYLSLVIMTLAVMAMHGATPDNLPVKSHFAWGASAGSNVDMTAHDMSSIDIDLVAGYRGGWVKFAGVGVGAEMMICNGSRIFPLYAELRSNFSRRNSLVFWDLKLGTSLNYLDGYSHEAGEYLSTGIGFNLTKGPRYTSHIMIGYTFHGMKPYDLHSVALSIGVLFH